MNDSDKTREQLLEELAEMRQRVAALEILGTECQSAQESLVRLTALRESEARNRALLGALPDLMFLLSSDGVFLDYHAADPRLLYVPPEQFLGRNVREVLPPEMSEAALSLYRKVLAFLRGYNKFRRCEETRKKQRGGNERTAILSREERT